MIRRLAIIPARGGSKRLPRKNILPFQGRPIIAHTIDAATASGCFTRILVSTEDAEIADAARAAGAEIHQRDPSLATDAATLTQVCLDILDSEERAGHNYDTFACLYATAPLRRADDIAAVITLAERDDSDFALAVTTYPLPPHQALRMAEHGTLTPMWPDLVNLRADSVGKLVVDNGSTNAAKIVAFRKHRTFYGPGLAGHVMPRERSVDIDEKDDYDLACWYAERLSARQ
jgi:pseudaminic acid cytidylyltransferase